MDRSPDVYKSAIESLLRMRGVETEPDSRGERTVWHRGIQGVELVSWVQADGTLSAQHFSAFESSINWNKATGVSTAHIKSLPGGGHAVTNDVVTDGPLLVTVYQAIKSYAGEDKFILHFRGVISPLAEDELSQPVTRAAPAFVLKPVKAEPKPPAEPTAAMVWIPIAIVVLSLIYFFATR